MDVDDRPRFGDVLAFGESFPHPHRLSRRARRERGAGKKAGSSPSPSGYHAGITTENGWGVAISDFDNDGDPDLFAHTPFVNVHGKKPGSHWLEVKVVGNVAANRAALGSTVRVTAGGKTRMRHVQGGTGKGGQDSLYLHFGLDDATSVDDISVTFPGGKSVVFAGPHAVDGRIWVYEDGTTFSGWAP